MKEKSFTDLEQSKKLAEILPHESADMSWVSCDDGRQKYYQAENRKIILNYEKKHWLYCWSLAALLDVIPKHTDLCKSSSNENKDIIAYWCYNFPNNLTTECYDNPVDACVAMIEKLHELKML